MLKLNRQQWNDIVAHARDDYPNECCGIVVGTDNTAHDIFRVTNRADTKRTRYLMDAQQQITIMIEADKNGHEILAFYHSHPQSEARPSPTDVAMALKSGWLDVKYILVSLRAPDAPSVRIFQITEAGDIIEEQFDIVD